MKALVLESPGDPPRLAVKEVPTPTPGPHDVLVKVAACGFCHHDILVMRGILRRGVKAQPILGHELAGEVVATGPQVSSVSRGDKVVSMLTDACGTCANCLLGREHRCVSGIGIGHGANGGFAEYVKVGENSLVRLAQGQDLVEASLLACPIGVAYFALREAAELRAGEVVVVTGAGGGLGVHAVQIAKAFGARVFAVTTSAEKEEGLRTLGADEVVLAPDLDFGPIIVALTGDQGADLVFNTVGAMAFEASWQSLAQFSRMVIIGEVAKGNVTFNLAELLFKDARLIGVSGTSRKYVSMAASLVAAGHVRPVISHRFPLEEALEAYRLIREKRVFGRAVLIP